MRIRYYYNIFLMPTDLADLLHILVALVEDYQHA